MFDKFYFGIDTSNYTTSAAVISAAGEVFLSKRHLPVPLGERGVRQSDALFSHTKCLPEMADEVMAQLNEKYPDAKIAGIGVSNAPRRKEGSYMPCFLAGMNAAHCAARIFSVPLMEFSHQEGHIAAALLGLFEEGISFPYDDFYAFHLSGGTSELLKVKKDEKGFRSEPIASALDITIGQFIDRCGVKTGMKFPAGKYLDELALDSDIDIKIKIDKKEKGINLSGFENKFDILMKTESEKYLAAYVFAVSEAAIRKMMEFIPSEDKAKPILFSGGVCSSETLKSRIKGENIYFSPQRYASDNAAGTAYLASMYIK